MKLTELASKLQRRVMLQSGIFSDSRQIDPDDTWYAYIDKVGFTYGFVTVAKSGKTPTEALEALAAAFNCKELLVDGNTDHQRYIGPVEVTV